MARGGFDDQKGLAAGVRCIDWGSMHVAGFAYQCVNVSVSMLRNVPAGVRMALACGKIAAPSGFDGGEGTAPQQRAIVSLQAR